MSIAKDAFDLARLILRKASSHTDGRNDWTAWQQCGAVTVGEVLTLCRAIVHDADKQSQDYLDGKGLKCPKCGAPVTATSELDSDSNTATSDVRCSSRCGWEGVELWELVGVEEQKDV